MASSPSSTLCKWNCVLARRVAARSNSVSFGSSSICKTVRILAGALRAPPELARGREVSNPDPLVFTFSDIKTSFHTQARPLKIQDLLPAVDDPTGLRFGVKRNVGNFFF